ncbi:MAG: hypothetical protein U0798_01260 [Gemmataceae bacterium]
MKTQALQIDQQDICEPMLKKIFANLGIPFERVNSEANAIKFIGSISLLETKLLILTDRIGIEYSKKIGKNNPNIRVIAFCGLDTLISNDLDFISKNDKNWPSMIEKESADFVTYNSEKREVMRSFDFQKDGKKVYIFSHSTEALLHTAANIQDAKNWISEKTNSKEYSINDIEVFQVPVFS